MNISQLRQKWSKNAESYKTVEIGGGVHDFINDVLAHPELFALKLTPKKTATPKTYVHDTEGGKQGRPDFVLYANKDVTMPCEVKCYTRIEEGIRQLQKYRSDYTKEYGILTDGFTWRFYRSNSYEIWTIEEILDNPKLFRTFWENYLKPENYYCELFQPSGQRVLFEEPLDLNDSENRKIFFKETSQLILNFRTKIKIKDDKTALETAYAYLIQFILYKVLVDNRFVRFESEYKRFKRQIVTAIQNKDLYNLVVLQIRNISEYISQSIYKPFAAEQQAVNTMLIADLKRELTIQDIAPWLDVVAYINRFDFSNLQNEIFGFVYENYLKDLYGDEPKGQFFTDPAVVNFMLDELGYTTEELAKDKTKISIIDPACGAGTFLYSAVDRIIETFGKKETQAESVVVKELIDKNVFGLDVAEFPLFLAEMCILLRQLPLTVAPLYESPVEKKLKLFKTKDSISEFLDANIGTQNTKTDWTKFFSDTDLGYSSFMRDNKDLQEMIESMQGHNGQRFRFDYVIGNPPYVGLNKCYEWNIPFAAMMRGKNPDGSINQNKKIFMNDIYGVNLHSVPGKPKKGRPNPNLYAFFIALSLSLLKEGGKLCYIIPQTLLVDGDYDVLRYHLAKYTTIEKLITFEGKLFVGRGLSQKRPVPTSSLILVVSKKKASEKHKVRIMKYDMYSGKNPINIARYIANKKRKIRDVMQSDLLSRFDNWNFINYDADDQFVCFLETYKKNTEDIALYYKHTLTDKTFPHRFYFDGGYDIDERLIDTVPSDYIYPKINNLRYRMTDIRGYWKNVRSGSSPKKIGLRQGNQGYCLLDSTYKVVWSYNNAKRFFFADQPVIWARNQFNAVGSEDKKEILYLFSLLNSPVTNKILKNNLNLENEKSAILISLSSLKKYVRIPKITARNQKLKDKIIALTESMLALEDVTLRDIADFGKLNVQKFDTIDVEKNELVLSNGKEFRLKISAGKVPVVQKVIQEKYKDGVSVTEQTISLTELKSLSAIDFDEQNAIKREIDDLVFALYFDVPVKDVAKHEFYDYVNS